MPIWNSDLLVKGTFQPRALTVFCQFTPLYSYASINFALERVQQGSEHPIPKQGGNPIIGIFVDVVMAHVMTL